MIVDSLVEQDQLWLIGQGAYDVDPEEFSNMVNYAMAEGFGLALDQLYAGRINLATSSIRKSLSLLDSQNKQAVDDAIVRLLKAKK